MAEYTATALQVVAENQNVLFTDTPIKATRCIVHREGSGFITLRGLSNQCFTRFKILFAGNIAVPTAGAIDPISISVSISGEPLNSSTAIVTPAAVGDFFNVTSIAMIEVPKGCCAVISISNTSSQSINVQNANLIVERVS